MSITVHTLDGRNNVMLEVIRDRYKLAPERMHREIQAVARQTSDFLASKGVDYADLRAALVPQQDRREAVFLYNIDFKDSGSYSVPVHQRLLKIINSQGSRSVMHGDIEADRHWESFEYADRHLERVEDRQFEHPMLYAVYVNNLTDQLLADIHAGMASYPKYVGYVDTTYTSMFKAFLSLRLIHAYVQYRGISIGQHEDDRDPHEDIDLVGLGFAKAGYKVRSIPGMNFMLLLSYKIERPVVEGYEADTEFSLNAINPIYLPLGDCEIEVDSRKFDYLAREKTKSLAGLGLLGGNAEGLKALIRERINANYIYSMVQDDKHCVSRFNLMLEAMPEDTNRRFRALVGLEYRPQEKRLRLITLF